MAPKELPTLSSDNEKELIARLENWSLSNGLVMYPANYETYRVNCAPVTLFPSPFPKHAFTDAIEVQKIFNELYANIVSKGGSFIADILHDLAENDINFTGKLFETYNQAIELNNGKVKQPISLGLFRSDYMVDSVLGSIKQVEFNSVSVSFGGLSTKVGEMHNYLNDSGAYDDNYSMQYYDSESVPISSSLSDLTEAIALAASVYDGSLATVVLFIVQENERNCFDQRHIEYLLLSKYKLKSYRLTLAEVQEQTTTRSDRLYMKKTMDEVSVVYFRSGYAPTDYDFDTDVAWGARLILEDSLAIKCPSLLTQLSGAKKIQQILTDPGLVRKFLPSISQIEFNKLMDTFVSIYPLDETPLGKKGKDLARSKPENFVLKPQREGGGNNIYKNEIPAFLDTIGNDEAKAYVLMELINPLEFKNKIFRDGKVFFQNIISELGIFGTVLFNEVDGEIISNKTAGWLLRSKFSSSNEGGVAAGFGCVDSIYLY